MAGTLLYAGRVSETAGDSGGTMRSRRKSDATKYRSLVQIQNYCVLVRQHLGPNPRCQAQQEITGRGHSVILSALRRGKNSAVVLNRKITVWRHNEIFLSYGCCEKIAVSGRAGPWLAPEARTARLAPRTSHAVGAENIGHESLSW